MTGGGDEGLEQFLELEPGVIRSNYDAHIFFPVSLPGVRE
jgi:hypothetical protein